MTNLKIKPMKHKQKKTMTIIIRHNFVKIKKSI